MFIFSRLISECSVSLYEMKRMYGDQLSTSVGRKKEEDEFIIQKVVEAKKNTSTGKICHGLWTSMGKELNRDPDLVFYRWKRKLSKDNSVILLLEDIEKIKIE